jgi:hypothetical protein
MAGNFARRAFAPSLSTVGENFLNSDVGAEKAITKRIGNDVGSYFSGKVFL